MDEQRKGRQTPTQSIVLPYESTYGNEAIDIYNKTGRTAQEWQELRKKYISAITGWQRVSPVYSLMQKKASGFGSGQNVRHTVSFVSSKSFE